MYDTATWAQTGARRYLRFSGLEAAAPVKAVFTGRHGGVSGSPFVGEPGGLNLSYNVGDSPDAVAENRRRALGLIHADLDHTVVAGLVHGTTVARVSAPVPPRGTGRNDLDTTGVIPGVDALITDTPGLALLVTCADCVPVLVVDPVRRCIGLAHAGWRGTAGGIAGAIVAALVQEFGARPDDLWALNGPGIGPCCYEVDAPVAAAMNARPAGASWLAPGARRDHWQLDLWRANADQLCATGIPAGQVHSATICTACQVERLFSHRAEFGRAGRQAAILMLDPGRAAAPGVGGGVAG